MKKLTKKYFRMGDPSSYRTGGRKNNPTTSVNMKSEQFGHNRKGRKKNENRKK